MAWIQEKRGKFNMGQAGAVVCGKEGTGAGEEEAEEWGMFGKW